jgi:hypothetical protein
VFDARQALLFCKKAAKNFGFSEGDARATPQKGRRSFLVFFSKKQLFLAEGPQGAATGLPARSPLLTFL